VSLVTSCLPGAARAETGPPGAALATALAAALATALAAALGGLASARYRL